MTDNEDGRQGDEDPHGDDGRHVDEEDVRHIASLARIDLDDGEVEQFVSEFEEILERFEALEDVPEAERADELTNVFRPDEVRESLTREEALRNAPETADGHFKGPNVS